jgi:hypothetical protein
VSRIRLVALAEFALSFLPPEERRAVILHDIENLSYPEIAARERIAPSTAFARYRRGIAAARQRVAEPDRHRVALVLAIGALRGDDDGPPPEVVERLWRRVAPHLNLEDFVEAQPPPSGTRLHDPAEGPPSSRPGPPAPLGRIGWLYRLGPLVAVFLGPSGLPEVPSASPPHEDPAVVATAPAIVEGAVATVPGPAVEAPTAPASVLRSVPRGIPLRSRRYSETALLDRVRDALKTSDLPGALAALAEHARLFPGEESRARHAAYWSQVCTSYRRTRTRPEVAELQARCSPSP